MLKPLIIFDLDNTLGESRLPLDDETIELLRRLLGATKVAIISGGAFEEFESRVISKIGEYELFRNLYILPTTGAELFVWRDDRWQKEYSSPFEKSKRNKVVEELSHTLGVTKDELARFIEDRGTQLTYSALGAHAPVEDKKKWDPTRVKRQALVEKLSPKLPGIHMAIGGRTSIDFTAGGVDKAFGVRKLLEYTKCVPEDSVFIGDALAPGGNDAAVRSIGMDTISTKGPEDTRDIIRSFFSI